jgi:hypothetical protein
LVTTQATGGVLVHDDDEYEHQISASVYEVDILAPGVCFHFVRTIPLAFGPDVGVTSPLRWMSHSSSGLFALFLNFNRARTTILGQLVAMDAEYTVRLFNAPRSLWFPIVIGSAILKEPEVDSLWPIAVIDAPDAQFRYSYCRGTRYPQTTRALVPTTIAWTLPVLNSVISFQFTGCRLHKSLGY